MSAFAELGPAGFGPQAVPQPIPDPAAAGVLMAMRDCLCTQAESTIYGPVCRCYVTWGATLPIQDGCSCTCGEEQEHNGDAWVKLDSMEPDLTGSIGSNELMGWCAPGWTATMTMGIYRCIPVAEGEDVLPDATMTDTSLALLSDMAALWRVLTCCPVAFQDGMRVVSWSPIDPLGGCAGGVLTVQVPLSGTNVCPT